MKKVASAMFTIMLGAMMAVIPAFAQGGFLTGRGTSMGVRPHVPFRGRPLQGGYLTGPRSHHRSHRVNRSYMAPYLYPYYYPGYYSDDYSQQARSEAPPTRVVVVENSQPRVVAPPAPPPESLVLELQGGHWVRITSSGQRESGSKSGRQASAKTSTLRNITAQQSAELETTRQLPPAVLVFRDGHKEEITRYTIIGGTIYTKKNYWNNGSWARKVPIAELNVPATLKLNKERGANFTLPSGPGEIVIRP